MKPHEVLLNMNSFTNTFANTQCCESDGFTENENLNSESADPLQGPHIDDTQPKCYRIDRVVFAEPLKNISNEDTIPEDHIKVNKEEITFIDNVAAQEQAGRKYKKYHINIEDPHNLTCPQLNCVRKFSSTQLLKAHVRKVHCAVRNRYICEQCGRGFSAQYLLNRHTMVHSEKRVECPICHTTLSCRTSLSSHLRRHSDLQPHQCSICSKSFSRSSTLATHVKFVHKDKPLECEQCEVRFLSRKRWSEHITNHKRKIVDVRTEET